MVRDLFTKWAFSVDEMDAYIKSNRKVAHKINDAVGAPVFASFDTLVQFAKTGDADYAVNKQISGADLDEMESILEVIKKDGFAEKVIEEIYDGISKYDTLKEAVIATRHKVLSMSSGLLVAVFVKTGDDIAKSSLESVIAAEINYYQCKDDHSLKNLKMATNIVREFVHYMTTYRDRMMECLEIDNETIARFAEVFVGELDDNIKKADVDILSIVDKTPEDWIIYSKAVGRVAAALAFAVSLGKISYEEYSKISGFYGRAEKELKDLDDKEVYFGEN